jgi:hypothetical protein
MSSFRFHIRHSSCSCTNGTRLVNQLPLTISLLPPPPREEEFSKFETWEGVGFSVEDDFVEGEDVVWSEEEVEVF